MSSDDTYSNAPDLQAEECHSVDLEMLLKTNKEQFYVAWQLLPGPSADMKL